MTSTTTSCTLSATDTWAVKWLNYVSSTEGLKRTVAHCVTMVFYLDSELWIRTASSLVSTERLINWTLTLLIRYSSPKTICTSTICRKRHTDCGQWKATTHAQDDVGPS